MMMNNKPKVSEQYKKSLIKYLEAWVRKFLFFNQKTDSWELSKYYSPYYDLFISKQISKETFKNITLLLLCGNIDQLYMIEGMVEEINGGYLLNDLVNYTMRSYIWDVQTEYQRVGMSERFRSIIDKHLYLIVNDFVNYLNRDSLSYKENGRNVNEYGVSGFDLNNQNGRLNYDNSKIEVEKIDNFKLMQYFNNYENKFVKAFREEMMNQLILIY